MTSNKSDGSLDDAFDIFEEIQTMEAIYPADEWKCFSASSYRLTIRNESHEVLMFITLVENYPFVPPKIELSAPTLTRYQKSTLISIIDDLSRCNDANAILFECAEQIREQMNSFPAERKKDETPIQVEINIQKVKCPKIFSGDTVTEKKSIFQGHLAEVHSEDEVYSVLTTLKENRKIAQATHNIFAFRIKDEIRGGYLEEANDDGEKGASIYLLELLKKTNVENVVLVVTRWFGGVLLGPSRFHRICDAGKLILSTTGHIKK